MRIQFYLFFLLLISFTKAHAINADQVIAIETENGTLTTSVYLSTSQPAKATILLRSPYLGLDSYDSIIENWVDRGYNLIAQSAAGTGSSSGSFRYLSLSEIDDSHKTLDWIEKQNFSTGKVIAFGESYDGYLALATGLTQHPTLKAVIAASAPTNPMTDSFTAGGMVEFALLKYYVDVPSKKRISKITFENRIESLYESMVPFDEFDEAFKAGGISDWDLIINESSQLNFKDRGVFHQLHLIKTPVLFMAGEIQDQDATDALHAFESRKDNWTQSSLKCPTKLAVGPWLHGAQTKLSREMASQFAEDALSSSVHCETPHQVEYIKNMEDIEAPQLLGDSFEDLFSTYSSQISISSVDYGFLFEDKFTEDNNSIELPLTCRPYEHISPGLSRPIAILDIEKDLVVHGPIEARFTVSSPDERFIGLSMDILIGKKDKGWSSFDDRYNMNRVRKRVYLQEDQITRLELTSPYHHFELEEGDQLIFSLQRSTKSADWCNGSFDWIMDDENNFEASFHYSEI